jgi:hypothetical protein
MNTDRQVLRGFIANVGVTPPLVLTFQFNPTSVSDNKAVVYADRKKSLCGNAPQKVYTGGGTRTITFDLKLDGLEQGTDTSNPTGVDNGISTELAKLRSFLYPATDAWAAVSAPPTGSTTGKRLTSPPTCYFGFGTKVLECVVTDIRINETLFNSSLAPVRADVTVTLAVIEDENNPLYEYDTGQRKALAALGIQNIRIF